MGKLIQYHQAAVFIIHISTADKLGLFVLMVLQEEVQCFKLASLSMVYIVLIGAIQVFKVTDIINTALR